MTAQIVQLAASSVPAKNWRQMISSLSTQQFCIKGCVVGLIAIPALFAKPAAAAVIIQTTQADTIFGSGQLTTSISYTNNGFTVTFLSPANTANSTAVSRALPPVPDSGSTASLPQGGTCLGGQRPAAHVAVCGNPTSQNEPQLNSILLSFNRDLFVTGFTVSARANTNDNTIFNNVSSTWSNGLGGSQSFGFSVDTNTAPIVSGRFRTQLYNEIYSPFFVSSTTPLTVTSSFTDGNLDYWISSITVQDVPGPLPALSTIAAFGWSRKLRRKLILRGQGSPEF